MSSSKRKDDLSKGLKGEELLKYVEDKKVQVDNDGDSICIGAGYGYSTPEGSTNCRLDLFSVELIKANKEKHLAKNQRKAKKEILECYNFKTLKNIAELGCVSGKAYLHLQISETEKFFDENKEEIRISLEDQFGADYLIRSVERVGEKAHWKHRAVWRFIEMIASEEVEKKSK